jgi:hypothetical protein
VPVGGDYQHLTLISRTHHGLKRSPSTPCGSCRWWAGGSRTSGRRLRVARRGQPLPHHLHRHGALVDQHEAPLHAAAYAAESARSCERIQAPAAGTRGRGSDPLPDVPLSPLSCRASPLTAREGRSANGFASSCVGSRCWLPAPTVADRRTDRFKVPSAPFPSPRGLVPRQAAGRRLGLLSTTGSHNEGTQDERQRGPRCEVVGKRNSAVRRLRAGWRRAGWWRCRCARALLVGSAAPRRWRGGASHRCGGACAG